MNPFPRSFYDRDPREVARDLLGATLAHKVDGLLRTGRVVETEAYLGTHDLAAHSSKGRTPRTEVMFGPPGHAYVYLIYGLHHCVNAVTQPQGHASAVLIRALEPLENIASSTKGPGLLCRALAITRLQNGHDLLSPTLFFAPPNQPQAIEIIERPRIGVSYAREWANLPLRYYIAANPFISKK